MRASRLFATLSLSLALLAPAFVLAQDHDRGGDDGSSMKIQLKKGKVRIRIRTADGKELDRELDADEFFRRLFDETEHRSKEGLPGLSERLERLRERFEKLRQGGDDDEADIIEQIQKTLRELPDKIEDALGNVEKELDHEKAEKLRAQLEKALEQLKRVLGHKEDETVRVRVGDKTMDVPARKGSARLY